MKSYKGFEANAEENQLLKDAESKMMQERVVGDELYTGDGHSKRI